MKKYLSKYSLGILLVFSLLTIVSCDTTELNLVNDPNKLKENEGNPEFYLNSVQLNFVDFFEEVTEPGMEVTRILHMFGPTYPEAYQTSRFNNAWREAYSSVLINAKKLRTIAQTEKLYTHIGITQVLEAYTMATLVDYFGDVPYSESLLGSKVTNPKADNGKEVYDKMYVLLDQAIANFQKDEAKKPSSDLFYGGNEDKWIKLANTIKLKLYLQSRLVNESKSKVEINKIIASGKYIKDSSDDFIFKYGTNVSSPDSRHPFFARNFKGSGGVTDYMANYYMDLLLNSFGVQDPRVRYYIYRQSSSNSDNPRDQACFGSLPPSHYSATDLYCNLTNPGYWGRDHGNSGGIPPDTGKRAIWGLYPVGGFFDADNFKSIRSTTIATGGSGIQPILMSSFVDFMLAESALTLGTSGNAKQYYVNGVTKSISTVTSFRTDLVDSDKAPSSVDITNYINRVSTLYDASSDKLDIVVKQYFLALWGNGVESFNTYRRTGKPSDVQQLVRKASTNCIRSFFYPDVYVNNNSNAKQKEDVFTQVFWDKNPSSNFIK